MPYVQMTLDLIKTLGIPAKMNQNTIKIDYKNQVDASICNIESDWSAASYFYGALAVLRDRKIQLQFLQNNSLQGVGYVESEQL